MKIAISSKGRKNTSDVDPRFGRAKWFLVFNTKTPAWTVHDNSKNADQPQGSGPRTVKGLSDLGVDIVITGRVGPKAYSALRVGRFTLFEAASMTVHEALHHLVAGDLQRMPGAQRSMKEAS